MTDDEIQSGFDSIVEAVATGFDAVNEKIGVMDMKITAMDAKFDAMDGKVRYLDEKIDDFKGMTDRRFDEIHARFNTLEKRSRR